MLPRLFGNPVPYQKLVPNGTILENGCGKMSRFNTAVLEDIRNQGYTHIWYTGLLEHATKTDYSSYGISKDHPAIVKGKAGSPYAVKDYYDIDPDLADKPEERMKEFRLLLRRTHRAGLKVVMDFIPNHVARQYHSDCQPEGIRQLGQDDDSSKRFDINNNFYYVPGTSFAPDFDLKAEDGNRYEEMPARATGNDHFGASPARFDWYETVKLNYGVDYANGTKHFQPVPSTWEKMVEILLFWCSEGVDAFRCDMAEMVPVEFWQWAIKKVKNAYPDVLFIAEVYNPFHYRDYIVTGGFDYLYDKVGMYDTLRKVISGMASATEISSVWWSTADIADHMLEFLENHDEQRIASEFFASDARKAIPGMIVAATLQKTALMVYAGQELGEKGMDEEGFSGRDGRTTIFDYWNPESLSHYFTKRKYAPENLTSEEKSLRSLYRSINLAKREAAAMDGEMFDLGYVNKNKPGFNEHKQLAYLRKFDDELLIVCVNFSDRKLMTGITLPDHAFEFLGFKPLQSVKATDLLSGRQVQISVCPEQDTVVEVPANGGVILKLRIEKAK